jgi:hypothetical protein
MCVAPPAIFTSIDPGNWCGSPQGAQACPPQAGTTVPTVPPSIAPSSTVPDAISNVASALSVAPATIQGDTTGFWTGFYAALAKASIDPAASSAATIQAAYQQYAGISASTSYMPLYILAAIAAVAVVAGGSR